MDFINDFAYFLETKSDPRTAKWFLVSSPGTVLTIIATYLYFCIYAGPRYMKDRKPFDLKNTITIYNFIQILLSIFLVYQGLLGGWANDYKFACQPVDYSNEPKALIMAGAVWWYFMCKISELLDTVFFILRKKMNQVTFLHVYHHALMPVVGWIAIRFLPGGHGTFLGLINSFIHVVMYSYYFVSSMGPQYQKYLWWKRHLTAMQMVQFCMISTHNLQMLFRQCDYPKVIAFLLGIQALFFLYMFGNFYYRSYVKSVKYKENNNVIKQNGNVKGD